MQCAAHACAKGTGTETWYCMLACAGLRTPRTTLNIKQTKSASQPATRTSGGVRRKGT